MPAAILDRFVVLFPLSRASNCYCSVVLVTYMNLGEIVANGQRTTTPDPDCICKSMSKEQSRLMKSVARYEPRSRPPHQGMIRQKEANHSAVAFKAILRPVDYRSAFRTRFANLIEPHLVLAFICDRQT